MPHSDLAVPVEESFGSLEGACSFLGAAAAPRFLLKVNLHKVVDEALRVVYNDIQIFAEHTFPRGTLRNFL